MKVSSLCRFAFLAPTVFLSGSVLSGTLTPAQLQQFAEGADNDVIVILRDQVASTPPARGSMLARGSAIATAQTPILEELRGAGASRIRSFGLINAVAARVSHAEATRLAAHPLVQAVVPDLVLRLPFQPHARETTGGAGVIARAGDARTAAAANASPQLQQICPSNPAVPLLEPEALQLTNTAFMDSTVPQAQAIVDGTGVKVAYIADGVDVNNPDFIRADGSHVFIDYQDFSGDGPNAPTVGAEAFGDASSIAAQGRAVYDLSTFVSPAHPLPPGCTIRIRGVAPGASLVGLKAFRSSGGASTSALVQAIEFAVAVDNVDVINESFGSAPLPRNGNDPISLANNAAVSAGVTVVVSTGDSGTAGTLGSPAIDADVIAVGATTQYRLDRQTTMAGSQLSPGGWISNNISPLSSGGFAERRARTVDVVAPGDLGWALCSTDVAIYGGCFDLAGRPASIQDFGGTSESSPLTAGLAALVIQAYRNNHGGADPAPALVKRIIMSTATNLGAPSFEQGAGLINALAAVNAALSVHDANGNPMRQGQGVVTQPTAVLTTDPPGAFERQEITVTNTGTTVQHLAPTLQMLAAPFATDTATLSLNPATDPVFLNASGALRSFILHQFTVPAGTQHLDAAIGFNTVGASPGNLPIVYLHLFDPFGRLAQYSIPQGLGSGYGHVDVVQPTAGTWTAVIATRQSGVGSYTGPVVFTASAEHFMTFGHVSPANVDLQPGQSTELTAVYSMPANPGDVAATILLGPDVAQSGGGPEAIPVSLRTLVPVGDDGGSFNGTLTGGNGRASGGPTQTFAFNVPPETKNLGLSLSVGDAGNALEGLLVDPEGMELSVQPNLDPTNPSSTPGTTLQLFHYHPQPGRWQFVLLQNFTASGHQTSLPFSAQISFFNNKQVATGHLPNDPNFLLSATAPPVTIPILVTNNGNSTELYFADARLATREAVQLGTTAACAGPVLQGGCALTLVPPETSAVEFFAQATEPINMNVFNIQGRGRGFTVSPNLFAVPTGPDSVMASLFTREVPYGRWELSPSLIGPYSGPAPTNIPFTTSAAALMQPFDTALSADSADAWRILTSGTGSFSPLVLLPGQSGTINVTITPDPTKVGQVVRGFLYIDTFHPAVSTGDEVVRLPYSYTVAP